MREYDRDGPAHRRAMAAAGRLRRMPARVIIDDADSRRMAKTFHPSASFRRLMLSIRTCSQDSLAWASDLLCPMHEPAQVRSVAELTIRH